MPKTKPPTFRNDPLDQKGIRSAGCLVNTCGESGSINVIIDGMSGASQVKKVIAQLEKDGAWKDKRGMIPVFKEYEEGWRWSVPSRFLGNYLPQG